MLRVCKRCGEGKPFSQYWRQSSRRDGYQSSCIDCMTNSHRKWRGGLEDEQRQKISERNKRIMDQGRKRDPLKQLYRSIKARAKKAGLEFTIAVEDIVIPSSCPVLGIPLVFGHKRGRGLKERDQRPSVDRIDNSKGYTPDNIVVVSYRANRIKSDACVSEIRKILEFYEALDENRIRNSQRARDNGKTAERNGQDDVSAMQPHPKKEKRPVSERDVQAGRGSVDVLARKLRFQRG